jgi:hypothetical protein
MKDYCMARKENEQPIECNNMGKSWMGYSDGKQPAPCTPKQHSTSLLLFYAVQERKN